MPSCTHLDTVVFRDVPDDITRPITHGWVAACVSGAITLLVTLVAMGSGGNGVGDGAWNLVDVGLIALLAFGIYKRSRTAATTLRGSSSSRTAWASAEDSSARR